MRRSGLTFGLGGRGVLKAEEGFLPPEIAGLHVWLDAARPATLIPPVGMVGRWDDMSSGARHAVQDNPALRPESGRLSHHGLNVLACDGVRNVLSFATGNFNALSDAGESTIYTVFMSAHGNATQRLICEPASTRYGLLLIGGRVVARHHAVTSNQATTPAYTANQAHIAFMRRAGAVVEARLDDGGKAGALADDLSLAGARIEIGGRSSSGGQELNGWIGEIIAYDRALSEDEDAQVMQYLRQKWAI